MTRRVEQVSHPGTTDTRLSLDLRRIRLVRNKRYDWIWVRMVRFCILQAVGPDTTVFSQDPRRLFLVLVLV